MMTYKEQIDQMVELYNGRVPRLKAEFREFQAVNSDILYMEIRSDEGDLFVKTSRIVKEDNKEEAYKYFYEECLIAAVGHGFMENRRLNKEREERFKREDF